MGAAVGRHDRLEEWLTPFRILFTHPTWQRVLVLATCVILRRIVARRQPHCGLPDARKTRASRAITTFPAGAVGASGACNSAEVMSGVVA